VATMVERVVTIKIKEVVTMEARVVSRNSTRRIFSAIIVKNMDI
jgi:hypothetical protein